MTPTDDPPRGARSKLPGRVVAHLRDLMERGELRPGDRLPPERVLAVQLGVSRGVLREALHTLAALDLVQMRHGSGAYVTAGSAAALARRLSESLSAGGDGDRRAAKVRELFEIRSVLEGAAAAWAAERATTDQLAQLRGLLGESERIFAREPLDARHAGELDARLHALIAASAANHALVGVMATLLEELTQVRENSLAIPGRAARSAEQHAQIVAAILARDPAAARAAMLEHLHDVEQSLLMSAM